MCIAFARRIDMNYFRAFILFCPNVYSILLINEGILFNYPILSAGRVQLPAKANMFINYDTSSLSFLRNKYANRVKISVRDFLEYLREH